MGALNFSLIGFLEQGQGLLSIIKQQLDNILSKVIPVPKQENCKCGKANKIGLSLRIAGRGDVRRDVRIAGGRDAKVRL